VLCISASGFYTVWLFPDKSLYFLPKSPILPLIVEIFAPSQEFFADSSSVVGAKNLAKICLQIAIKLCNIEGYDVFAGEGLLLLAQYLQ